MNWNQFIRQCHRWLSIAFTVTVIAVIASQAFDQLAEWLFYLPLAPLALLLLSGLYLFVLPYMGKAKRKRAVAEDK